MHRSCVTVALLMVLGAAACAQEEQGTPVPVGPDPVFAGASANDFWAIAPVLDGIAELAHWDGSTWREIPKPMELVSRWAMDEASRLWMVGAERNENGSFMRSRLVRLAPDGTLDDFSSMLADNEFHRTYVYAGHGTTFLLRGGTSGNDPWVPYTAYVFDGASFQPLPEVPSEYRQMGNALPFADDHILVHAVTQPPERKSLVVRWNGATWEPLAIEGNSEAFALQSAPRNAPANDLWLSCGPMAKRFDGEQLHPLALPSLGRCWFAYDGGYKVVYEYGQAEGDPGEAVACDIYGNCTPIDTYANVDSVWRAARWDGTKWIDDRPVATVDACVGAGCVYGAGRRLGVYGWLDDGTVVFVGSVDGVERYWLVD